MDQHGPIAYLVFFGTLEVYAREWKPEPGWKLTVSWRYLVRKLRQSRSDLVRKCLKSVSDSGKWRINEDGPNITIYIPKFTEMIDEYSRKRVGPNKPKTDKVSGQYPDNVAQDLELDLDREEESKKEGKNPPMQVPHKEIIALYHEILPELPRVEVWTPDRQALLRTRWKENLDRQNLDWWKGYFIHVRECPLLMGKKNEFRASLEWLIRPKNMPKVLEGNYLDRKGPLSMFSEKGQRTAENLARALAAGGGDE